MYANLLGSLAHCHEVSSLLLYSHATIVAHLSELVKPFLAVWENIFLGAKIAPSFELARGYLFSHIQDALESVSRRSWG